VPAGCIDGRGWRMIPKKLAPAKAVVADFSDKIMCETKA
jgi:hypothetical protein